MIERDGKVAIRRIPARVKLVTVRGTEYIFLIRGNVALCWVDKADVPDVLAIKQGCCGGGKKQVFYYADETHLRRWENNGGR